MPDFVVVGGGVYGCGAAWELAKLGAEVLLLEAESIASGASGGLGKRGVRANGRDVRELPLVRIANQIWPILHEKLGNPTDYETIGNLQLIEREQDLTRAESIVWMQTQQGIPTRLLNREELLEIEPFVSNRVRAAIFCPGDGIADHTRTTQSYARAVEKLGVEVRENTRVTAMEREGDRVTALITDQSERIPVNRAVLLLSNTHVPQFLKDHLNITLPVWKIFPQVAATVPVDLMPVRHLIGHSHRKLAMKVISGDRVMISGGWHGRTDPRTGRGVTIPEQVEGNRLEAVAVYPTLESVAIEQADASRPEMIAIDDIPIIDRFHGAANMIAATGWSGHGWAIAPAVTPLLASLALTGTRPDLLAPFSFDRFAP